MSKNLYCLILLAVTWLFPGSTFAQYKLWYNEPARVWTDALPLGNGRLGAMVYGIPATERIQLNEETIWTGQPNANANPEALKAIPVIQQLLFQEHYRQAEDMASAKVMSATNWGMAYQTFGDVYIAQKGVEDYTDYQRTLYLDSATCVTTFFLFSYFAPPKTDFMVS